MAIKADSTADASDALAAFLAGKTPKDFSPSLMRRMITDCLDEILCSGDPEVRGRAAAAFRDVGFDLSYQHRILSATYKPATNFSQKQKELFNLPAQPPIIDSCKLAVDDARTGTEDRVSSPGLEPLGLL